MKNPQDPRHKKREKIIKKLFSWSFRPQKHSLSPLINSIINHQEKIDKIIQDTAKEWPVEQINKIDLAILRLAIYELLVLRKEPPKVIIDEAIELGKSYGSEKSQKFINGVLGSVLKKIDSYKKLFNYA